MSCLSQQSFLSSALLSPEETRQMDQAMEAILPMIMERAGMMAARLIRQHVKPCRVVVACGPGNNGGDGYVLARHLLSWGWPVRVAMTQPPVEGSLAQQMAARWHGDVVDFTPQEAARAELVVDAVFGAGVNRPLPPLVEAFFAAAPRIIAIDVPSGLDGATGSLMGQVAPCAKTIALIRKRPGHLLLPGRSVCGEVLCADLAIPEAILADTRSIMWENGPALWALPQQEPLDHKYSRGVVSVCGGAEMPGAAFFASEAARHVGAGMVRLTVPEAAAMMYRLASPAAIVDTQSLAAALEDKRRHVWVCGPGLQPDEVGRTLPLLQKEGRQIVVDAGAFSWAAGNPERLKGATVMTPHMGEFARLFGPIQGDRLQAARHAAKQLNLVVVLKGADSIIAAPDGRVAINSHATPALAVAGAGDVLSGIIATCLAAGMPAWEAAAASVWVHGEAARRAAALKGGWIVPEDIFAQLGLARQAASHSPEDAGKWRIKG
ncbi:NAD(P)H-hydrate dehydratase [Bombella sp. ESL0378]|uniref:NAD(P)H-hydrate dehydratase n=1 Tax=Bombella sp. ESL0378 TaxID=2676442 RepID=UPI0012D95E18|nr:NAD(P)H-hydrate dehydratase [Bombella sp. ESL0378]MUG04822.1 NAD(P)H-hydrate dehydratase [Bombella sp. ESL0378]